MGIELSHYYIRRFVPGWKEYVYWAGRVKITDYGWTRDKDKAKWYSRVMNARIAATMLRRMGTILRSDEIDIVQ